MSPDDRDVVNRALTLVLVSLAWLAWLAFAGLAFLVTRLTSSGVPT